MASDLCLKRLPIKNMRFKKNVNKNGGLAFDTTWPTYKFCEENSTGDRHKDR